MLSVETFTRSVTSRINLGNEGVLVLGAMVGYATSYETGSPWLGVLAAAAAGLLSPLHRAGVTLAFLPCGVS